MQAKGDAQWWKLKEAALLAAGCLSEDIEDVVHSGGFDIAGLLNSVLREDLDGMHPPGNPFLAGRALWLSAKYDLMCQMPPAVVIDAYSARSELWF